MVLRIFIGYELADEGEAFLFVLSIFGCVFFLSLYGGLRIL